MSFCGGGKAIACPKRALRCLMHKCCITNKEYAFGNIFPRGGKYGCAFSRNVFSASFCILLHFSDLLDILRSILHPLMVPCNGRNSRGRNLFLSCPLEAIQLDHLAEKAPREIVPWGRGQCLGEYAGPSNPFNVP